MLKKFGNLKYSVTMLKTKVYHTIHIFLFFMVPNLTHYAINQPINNNHTFSSPIRHIRKSLLLHGFKIQKTENSNFEKKLYLDWIQTEFLSGYRSRIFTPMRHGPTVCEENIICQKTFTLIYLLGLALISIRRESRLAMAWLALS